MRLGWPEVLLLLSIVFVVFGVGKLPQIGAQLGKGIRQFRQATRADTDEERQLAESAGNDLKAG